jgi:hypothetical protein
MLRFQRNFWDGLGPHSRMIGLDRAAALIHRPLSRASRHALVGATTPTGSGYAPPRFGRKFREEALPSIVPRNTKTLRFPGLSLDSGGRIRTCDLRVMSPTSYQTAPPRVVGHVLAKSGHGQKPCDINPKQVSPSNDAGPPTLPGNARQTHAWPPARAATPAHNAAHPKRTPVPETHQPSTLLRTSPVLHPERTRRKAPHHPAGWLAKQCRRLHPQPTSEPPSAHPCRC